MVLINFYCLDSCYYFLSAVLTEIDPSDENFWKNFQAVVDSLALIVHEWLFTDQFLQATLLLDKYALKNLGGRQ